MKLRSQQMTSWLKMAGIFAVLAALTPLFGQDEPPPYESYDAFVESGGFALFTVNNLWLLISAALVFIMHLGFSCVETGLTQSKNTVNILFKNLFIVSIGILGYAFWGFNSMYPGDFNGFFATGSWFGVDNEDVTMMTDAYAAYTWWTDFIFQAMFAATAATIVSGAVAERVKLSGFMIYATLLVTFFYPITGSWQWGGGWLSERGFYDFAGSSLVHAFGGFAALAAVLVLGPRNGKYLAGGKVKPILGHSMPLAAIGVFMLWLGWYGFNGGSVLSADPRGVSYVFVTTTLAAAMGAVSAMMVSWGLLKKPDLSMGLNGVLAGLVGITAGADSVSMSGSIWIGLIAGALVVFAIIFFDKIKIDDPVGAISVHGVCGIWGTIAVALFSDAAPFGIQLIGTLSVSAFAFVVSLILAILVKVTIGIRVSADEESEGLDIGEHGAEAYPDFTPAHKG
ncbi:ammonium transporter [Actomonas aquatica]|uniref:Ammonium transporter n=1 Tax=Actomonas aquatica TaxID=2866162 RepID=A0ABZ1C7Z9_9BACT|nr:ammonium transporter [Opitutus sp. WL0086]WRQ87515.1 ammonium transporter [Opitutus sp. WL0086]